MSVPLQPAMRPGQGGYFRTFLIGGGITAAILSGAWMSMLWAKKRQQLAGRNPYYEHILQNSAARQSADLEGLKPLSHKTSHYSMQPPAHVNNDHINPHYTIEQAVEHARLTGADINEIRRMVPPPQRGRNDGSGRAYPKSPDYVDNYGKTVHARSLQHGGAVDSTSQKTEGLKAW